MDGKSMFSPKTILFQWNFSTLSNFDSVKIVDSVDRDFMSARANVNLYIETIFRQIGSRTDMVEGLKSSAGWSSDLECSIF